VGALRREQSIPRAPSQPPDWRLPPGFPDPEPWVRGFHQGRLTFLLRERDGVLWSGQELRGGL